VIKNLGIALGGGGAKGLAHIGVIEVLEEHGIRPQHVAGTSIGSIVGAMYCLTGSAKELKAMARAMIDRAEFKKFGLDEFYTDSENVLERFKKEIFEKFYFGRLFFKKSHIKTEATKNLFNGFFGNRTFEDLSIRFICNSLDIQSGEEILFSSGRIAEAVWASCAIPGILPPFVKDQKILIDGGVIDNIPIEPVKSIGAGIVLAVYLGDRPRFHGEPDTGLRINQRALAFMKYHFDQRILDQADLVIKPDVAKFHWADFSALDELVVAGRTAALKDLKQIKKVTGLWNMVKKRLDNIL
jgi:NTE family protein